MVDDKFVLNPSQKELEESSLNIVVTVANNENIGKFMSFNKRASKLQVIRFRPLISNISYLIVIVKHP